MGLKRTKSDWADDLSGFMEIVAGYIIIIIMEVLFSQ